jgi:lysophospholipase L1-like esterase
VVQRYGGREGENIYLVPVYVNFDAEHSYPTSTASANARASEAVVRVYNGMHPSPEGYQQIADSIYCWLKAVSRAEGVKSK